MNNLFLSIKNKGSDSEPLFLS